MRRCGSYWGRGGCSVDAGEGRVLGRILGRVLGMVLGRVLDMILGRVLKQRDLNMQE